MGVQFTSLSSLRESLVRESFNRILRQISNIHGSPPSSFTASCIVVASQESSHESEVGQPTCTSTLWAREIRKFDRSLDSKYQGDPRSVDDLRKEALVPTGLHNPGPTIGNRPSAQRGTPLLPKTKRTSEASLPTKRFLPFKPKTTLIASQPTINRANPGFNSRIDQSLRLGRVDAAPHCSKTKRTNQTSSSSKRFLPFKPKVQTHRFKPIRSPTCLPFPTDAPAKRLPTSNRLRI